MSVYLTVSAGIKSTNQTGRLGAVQLENTWDNAFNWIFHHECLFLLFPYWCELFLDKFINLTKGLQIGRKRTLVEKTNLFREVFGTQEESQQAADHHGQHRQDEEAILLAYILHPAPHGTQGHGGNSLFQLHTHTGQIKSPNLPYIHAEKVKDRQLESLSRRIKDCVKVQVHSSWLFLRVNPITLPRTIQCLAFFISFSATGGLLDSWQHCLGVNTSDPIRDLELD